MTPGRLIFSPASGVVAGFAGTAGVKVAAGQLACLIQGGDKLMSSLLRCTLLPDLGGRHRLLSDFPEEAAARAMPGRSEKSGLTGS